MVALPPLLIFKAKYTNCGWIPANTPRNWQFSTSKSGWTSDTHAYQWISTLFDAETRKEDSRRRLLLIAGHGSHLTSSSLAHCLSKTIDVVVLPPHSSHILQPLDVGVFSPLKRALTEELDALFRLDSSRISRVDWTAAYINARQQAFSSRNIISAFHATGLSPLSPITVLSTLTQTTTPQPQAVNTSSNTSTLNTSLLQSSPPDNTELRDANLALFAALKETELALPIKRYIARATPVYE